MKTQKEVNNFFQENTVNVYAIYEIVRYLKDFNLKLPNNVILHENGITQVDFFNWFENKCFKAGDVVVSPSGNIVLISHINNKDIIFYHCILYPFDSFKIGIDCGIGTASECCLASSVQKHHLFKAIYDAGYQYDIETNILKPLKKFDISTLKSFDKVLVKDLKEQVWVADIFSHKVDRPLGGYMFACVGHYSKQCIPYEGNEHLLGTSNDCDDFYKTWE